MEDRACDQRGDLKAAANVRGNRYVGIHGLTFTPAEILTLAIVLVVFSAQSFVEGIVLVILCAIGFLALHRSKRLIPELYVIDGTIVYVRGRVRQTASISQVTGVKVTGNWFVGKTVDVFGIINLEIGGINKPVRQKMVIQDAFDIDVAHIADIILSQSQESAACQLGSDLKK